MRFAKPRRLMTGPYNARNPLVVGAMATLDGIGAIMALRPSSASLSESVKSVLVANSGHLGDLVVMLPFLTRLRERFPIEHLGVLIGPWGRPVFDAAPVVVDQVHLTSHVILDRGPQGRLEKLKRHLKMRREAISSLHRAGYDLAVDTYPFMGNASDVLWASGIPRRVGFSSGGGGTFYTRRVRFDPLTSIVSNQTRLFEAAGLPVGEPLPAYPAFTSDKTVKALTHKLGSYIVIHLGAGEHTRAWPTNAWIALCQRLKQDGFALVFTGSKSERQYANPVRAAVRGIDFLGKQSFQGFATTVKQASGLICIDTVAGHLAASFGVPSVVLFNGIQPSARWVPNQSCIRSVRMPVGCSPCCRTAGCSEMPCLQRISVADVYDALTEVLAQKR